MRDCHFIFFNFWQFIGLWHLPFVGRFLQFISVDRIDLISFVTSSTLWSSRSWSWALRGMASSIPAPSTPPNPPGFLVCVACHYSSDVDRSGLGSQRCLGTSTWRHSHNIWRTYGPRRPPTPQFRHGWNREEIQGALARRSTAFYSLWTSRFDSPSIRSRRAWPGCAANSFHCRKNLADKMSASSGIGAHIYYKKNCYHLGCVNIA